VAIARVSHCTIFMIILQCVQLMLQSNILQLGNYFKGLVMIGLTDIICSRRLHYPVDGKLVMRQKARDHFTEHRV
jgi:hypothetical protein